MMKPRHKVPVVLAALLFILAAVAEVATGRMPAPGGGDWTGRAPVVDEETR
jgi:hypothetical protein